MAATQAPRILRQYEYTGQAQEDAYDPHGAKTFLSAVTVINRNQLPKNVEIAIAPNGETDATKHILIPATPVQTLSSQTFPIGVQLNTGDVVRVRASSGMNLHFIGFSL